MNLLQIKQTSNILDLLHTKKINYVSLTVFKNNLPVVFQCNHEEWLYYHKAHYNVDHQSPVQKYIISSKLNVLIWNLLNFDSQTREYIQRKNHIVDVKTNISLVYQKNEQLIAMTLGTKQSNRYLIDFINYKADCLSLIMKNLFYNTF